MSTIQNSRFFPENSHFRGGLYSPSTGERIFDQSIPISGWFAVSTDARQYQVQAWHGEILLGQTILFAMGPGPEQEAGVFTFHLLARFPVPIDLEQDAQIRVTATPDGGVTRSTIAEVTVRIVPAQLQLKHYGNVLAPMQTTVLHRNQIYGSGPPVEQASPAALQLVLQYLPAQCSVVDVGCGAGAYAAAVMKSGRRWIGLERNPACCAILERRCLPYRRSSKGEQHLNAADQEFDCAICIEVLEHVPAMELFLAEIARVIRARALFSVPNLEIIPYLASLHIVPWHLLEGDHQNFFTRTSLRTALSSHFRTVEVFSYGEHPVATSERIRTHAHLFAVAEK